MLSCLLIPFSFICLVLIFYCLFKIYYSYVTFYCDLKKKMLSCLLFYTHQTHYMIIVYLILIHVITYYYSILYNILSRSYPNHQKDSKSLDLHHYKIHTSTVLTTVGSRLDNLDFKVGVFVFLNQNIY